MSTTQPTEPIRSHDELLYFWAIGDLHFRAIPAWHEAHTQRLAPMFEDMHAIWREEGRPAFCVSPGDLVEACTFENHRLAKVSIEEQLDGMPFYPGIGNHEFFDPDGENPTQMVEAYTNVWEKPLRYVWQAGNVICVMLDYPDPRTLAQPDRIYISQDALTFLDTTLAAHAGQPAVIFLHCPLYNTVLDRDPAHYRDYNSLQHFFSPENSQEIRTILARHSNAGLFFSGHTHSGWEAPNLVCTETLGEHPVTFVNLMSPWYTGTHRGPTLSADRTLLKSTPDDPDVVTSFAVRVWPRRASIRIREHKTREWLKEWVVPLVKP